jgi:hypothetical protein
VESARRDLEMAGILEPVEVQDISTDPDLETAQDGPMAAEEE